jgi:trehalose/maltose transport system substrate-binding protein
VKSFYRNSVTALMQDAIRGTSSRRELIKRGSALGVSSALMGTILRAQSVGAQATPGASPAAAQPAGWSIETPEWLRTDLQGQTVSAVLAADGPGAPFDQAMCDHFAKATGAKVNYIKGAESATDRLTFLSQTFAAGSADVDVAQIDVIWPGTLAIHSVDLSQQLQELKDAGANFFDRIVQNNTVNDSLVGIPWYTDAGLLYYRTDLLEKYQYSKPPETWQELQDMATKIMEGEVGANSAFTGFTFQASAYEGLTCNGLEWQFSNGGGTIVDENAEVTVNNDQAKAMLEMAKGWIGTISPEAVTGYKEEDSRGVWQGGNAAFHRNWPYVYAISSADDSDLQGKFDIVQLPMGDGEGATHAATLGGWQMFVSKYSQSQDAAKEFAKFACSPQVQKARAIERSLLPTIGDLYKDQDVLGANPFFGTLFDVFESGSVARPSTATADLYPQVSVAYFTKVNEILTGQQSDVGQALEDLAGELDDILQDL